MYCWKQSYLGYLQPFTEYELTGLFAEFKQYDYCNLPAQTAQQVIKLMFKNVKSFYEAKREYKKNPDKFLGEPKPPKYKKETSITIFTNQQIRLRDGCILFPISTGLKNIKTKVDNVCQVLIVPKSNHCVIEVVYNFKEPKIKEVTNRSLEISLGKKKLMIARSKKNNI